MGFLVLAESKYVYIKEYAKNLGYLKRKGLGSAEIKVLSIGNTIYQKAVSMSFAKLITGTYNGALNIWNGWFSLIVAKVQITGGRAVLLGGGGINARYGGQKATVCIGSGDINVPITTSSYSSMDCYSVPTAKIIDEGTYTIVLGVGGTNVSIIKARGALVLANVSEELLLEAEKWKAVLDPSSTSNADKEEFPFGRCFRRMDNTSKLVVDMEGPFLGFAYPLNNSSSPDYARLDIYYNRTPIFNGYVTEDSIAPTRALALANDGKMTINVHQETYPTYQSLCLLNFLQAMRRFEI